MEKENSLINGTNHVITSMNRVKKIQLLIKYSGRLHGYMVYQCTHLNSILFNYSMLDNDHTAVRNKVDLITHLIIDSNCSISSITET